MNEDSEVVAAVDQLLPDLLAVSREIHAHPELRFEEEHAAGVLTGLLENNGFQVERGVGKMPTAFEARRRFGAEGGRVALVCEYDALEGIGHACGHNIIAAAGAGAALAVAAVLANRPGASGELLVVGSPGEEGGGGKVRLVEAGVFHGIDAALMVHPAGSDEVYRPNLGRLSLEVVFRGRASHAASAPEQGRNALDAAALFLVAVGLLRQQIEASSRIHAIIVDGGDAVNVIPEHTRLKVFVRSPDATYLRGRLLEGVNACATGAAVATGTGVTLAEVAPAYVPMRPNEVLSKLIEEGFRLSAREPTSRAGSSTQTAGSTDMGNVSEVVPSIHPYICISPGVAGHTRDFEAAAGAPGGDQAVRDGAILLAHAAVKLLESPELVRLAWERHRGSDV